MLENAFNGYLVGDDVQMTIARKTTYPLEKMHMKKLLCLALAMMITVCWTVTTNAEDKKPKKDWEAIFKKKDKDSDGKLSLNEYVGKRTGEKKEKAEKQFKRKDKDSDGSLTLDEFKPKKKKKKK